MDQTQKKRDQYLVTSLYKGLKVLDVLSVRDNLGVAEIAAISGLDKATVFKLLYTLEKRDYVSKSPDAKYRLGIKFLNFGDIVSERQSISEVAKPYMQELRSCFHETVSLSVLNANGRTIILHFEEGDSPHSAPSQIGMELDAHTTAMGKVLLSFLDTAVQKSMLENMRFKSYTQHTISSAEQLYPVLKQVREQGYCMDKDERYLGRSTMAAPLFDATGQCVAAISFVCNNGTLQSRQKEFQNSITRVAGEISVQLGYYR